MPIVFAISVVRCGFATRTTRFAVRLSAENAAAAIAFAVAGDVELEPGRRRPDHDLPRRGDLEVRVLRLARDGGREPLEVLLGAAGRRSRRSCCRRRATRAAARSASAAPASASRRRTADRRRERGARLRRSVGEIVARSPWARWSRAEARPALPRSKRGERARRRWPRPRRGRAAGPVMPSTTRMSRPLRTSLGVDALAVDAVRDLGELVADGGVVRLDRRRDARRRRSAPAGA